MCYYCPNSKFQSVSLYGQTFLSYRPFWKKCTGWPQIDLNPTRSPVPHIGVTSIHESHISLRFGLWPAVFKIQAILKKKTTPTDPKMTLNPTGQIHHIHVLLVSMTPKFRSISLYDQPFSKYRQFWGKCTEWPQNDLKPYKVKGTSYVFYYYPRVCVLSISLSIKFHLIFLDDQPFSRYNVVDNQKCTSEWPQNDLEHLTVKRTLYILNTNLHRPIIFHFTLW